jgi:hypothetical protein
MKKIDYEKVFYDLLNIVKSNNVEDYLSVNGLLNRDLWKNINGVVNTDGIIQNSNADCVPALTEKLTNSVDALIEREIELHNNSVYPKKYKDVINNNCKHLKVENSFNKQPHLFNSDPNIYIVSRLGTTIPTLNIIDRGIGQDITTFESTFLTMTNSNKITKFCLNGAYNTGSFSIVRHLKEPNYQLIISKKPASLIKDNKNKDVWTYSLLRIFEPKKGTKLKEFKFLCPNGELPHFESKAGIRVIPINDDKKNRGYLEHGTLIQLYECDTKGFNSLITSELKYRLGWYYPNIPFPVSMIEEREYESKGSEKAKLNGIVFEFEHNIKEGKEAILYHVDKIATVGKYKIPYTIYIENPTTTARGEGEKRTKKNTDRKKRGDMCYFFTVNGQTQATKSNWRIKHIYSYILKNIVMFIDYSSIEPHELGKHIKTDRSGLNTNSVINEEIFKIIEDELRDNPHINAIEEEIRRFRLNSSNDYNQDEAKKVALKCVHKLFNLKETPIATDSNGVLTPYYTGKENGLPKDKNGKYFNGKHKGVPRTTNYPTIDDFILKYSKYDFDNPKVGYKDENSRNLLYSDKSVEIEVYVDGAAIETSTNSEFPGNSIIYINYSSDNGFRVNKNSEVTIKFYIDNGGNIIEKEVTYNIIMFEKREETDKPQVTNNRFAKVNDKINVIFQKYEELADSVLTNSFKLQKDIVAIPVLGGENNIDIYFNMNNPNFVRVLDSGAIVSDDEQGRIKSIIDVALRVETLKLYDVYHRLSDDTESKTDTSDYNSGIISLASIMKETTLEKLMFNHFYTLQDGLVKLYNDEIK